MKDDAPPYVRPVVAIVEVVFVWPTPLIELDVGSLYIVLVFPEFAKVVPDGTQLFGQWILPVEIKLEEDDAIGFVLVEGNLVGPLAL